MKRILVSGGAGFIGSHLVTRLAASGVDVTVLDSLLQQVHGEDPSTSYTYRQIEGTARFVRGDVRERAAWEDALAGVTQVVHLAAETGTGQSMYRIGHYCDVNVGGTSALLDLLSSTRHEVRQVVVASSRAVYGEGSASCPEHGVVHPGPRLDRDLAAGDFAAKCPMCARGTEPVPTREDAPTKPASVYAITKLAQEQLVLETCAALGIGALALRFQNVYGPGQSLVNPYTGILSIFSAALLGGQAISVFEDGHESRDFVFVDDVVDALERALACEACAPQPVNVGSGLRSSVLDVVEALSKAYGKPAAYTITGDYRAGDVRHHFADTTRMHELLGVRARWDLERGVEQLCAWAAQEVASAGGPSQHYQGALHEARAAGLLKRSGGEASE